MYVFMEVSLLNVSVLPVCVCVHLKTICLFYVKISILLLPSYIHIEGMIQNESIWNSPSLDVQHRLLMPSLIVSILFIQFKIKKFFVLFRHLWKFPEIFIATYCSLVHESPCFYNGQYLLDENVSIVSQKIKFILKNIFIFLLFHVILLFTIVPFITSIVTFFYSPHFFASFPHLFVK